MFVFQVIVKDEVHNSEIATASTLIDLNNVKHSHYVGLDNNPYKRGVNDYSHGMNTRNVAIDTHELELYCNDRTKSTISTYKTVGIDTSDLEAHYDYYRHETLKSTKTVSTDTRDLDYLKKVYSTSSVSVDTKDLQTIANFDFVSLTCHNGVKTEPSAEGDDSKSSASRLKNSQKENRNRGKATNNSIRKTDVITDDSSDDRDDKFDDVVDVSNNDSTDNEVDDTKDFIKKEENGVESIRTRRSTRTRGNSKHETNSSKRFECEVCKATFTRKHSLMVHLCIHSGLRPFTCTGCGKAFSTSGQAQRHARLHPQSEEAVKEEEEG